MQTNLLKRIYLKGGEKYYIHTITGTLYAQARRRGEQQKFADFIPKRGRRSNKRVGTLRVSLYINGEYVVMPLALLVLATMKGPRGQEYYPHHRNGDKNDCTPNNLEWRRNTRKASLWDVLTDEEYEMWKRKLATISGKKELKEFNRDAWRKYLRSSGMLARKPWKRKEFFEKLFRI